MGARFPTPTNHASPTRAYHYNWRRRQDSSSAAAGLVVVVGGGGRTRRRRRRPHRRSRSGCVYVFMCCVFVCVLDACHNRDAPHFFFQGSSL